MDPDRDFEDPEEPYPGPETLVSWARSQIDFMNEVKLHRVYVNREWMKFIIRVAEGRCHD
jgi:hypothetical protein